MVFKTQFFKQIYIHKINYYSHGYDNMIKENSCIFYVFLPQHYLLCLNNLINWNLVEESHFFAFRLVPYKASTNNNNLNSGFERNLEVRAQLEPS